MISAAELIRTRPASMSRAEAEFLLTSLLQSQRHQLYDNSLTVAPAVAAKYRRLCRQAGAGAPLQYLVHSAPFIDTDIYVDRRVVIPRPETEELVIRSLDRCKSVSLALDYGTGSGCIAIAIARRFPRARVFAPDCSRSALLVAARNIRRYQLNRRIFLLCADSLRANCTDLARLRGRIDLLISNPPYIPSRRLQRLEPRVSRFEPRLGLDGGPKGATIVAMLLKEGPKFLKPGGLLAVEIDHTHAPLVRQLAPDAVIERDFAGHVRYVFLTAPGT